MVTETKELTQGIISFSRDNKMFMGIHLPGKSLKWVQEEFRKNKNIHGWILTNGALEIWQLLGYVEIDEKVYMYGPYIEGTWLQNMDTKDLSMLEELAQAMDFFEDKSLLPEKFYPQGILFANNGDILLLPELVTSRVIKTQPQSRDNTMLYQYEMLNHPDYKGGRNAGYALAVMLYKEATGNYPYELTTTEEYHDKIREHGLIPPKNINPEIKESLSLAIMKSMGKVQSDTGRRVYLNLSEWKNKIGHFVKTGITTDISAEDRAEWEEEGQELEKKYSAAYKQKVFFRKNGRLVIGIMTLSIILVFLIGGYILKQLEPPKTLGMSPRQIVTRFYTGITNNDYYSMKDCVTDGAGDAELRKAGEIRAFTGIRYDQEGGYMVMDAQKWVENGREKSKEYQTVYGIADLKLESQNEEGTHFMVYYEKWLPDYEEKENGSFSSYIDGEKNVDSVYLKNMGNHWRIYQIDRISTENLERIYFIR